MFDEDFLNQLRVKPIYRTDIYYGFLFHGTRRYSFGRSKEEREALYNAAKVVNTFADNIFNNGYFKQEELTKYLQTKIVNGHNTSFGWPTLARGTTKPDTLFQYGDLYVTTSIEDAVHYSDNPGGEFADITYCNVVGLKDFKVKIPDEVNKAMELFEKEYDKHQNSERIVVAVKYVEFKDMLSERGEELRIDENDPNRFYREHRVYRIINFDKYRDSITIIPESYFKEVEKLIRESRR